MLGLPVPDPASRLTTEEEGLLQDFLAGWSLAGNEETSIRAARLMGEGTRQVAMGWPHPFAEQIAGRARGRSW